MSGSTHALPERASRDNPISKHGPKSAIRLDRTHHDNVADFAATRRRRAEEALHGAQVEAARAARPATRDQLLAAIAHEINQPLAAVVTNANACLRWLANDPPNLEEARAAAKRIVRDGYCASAMAESIRLLAEKR